MKRYWTLAIFGMACLAAAAVWMGALNQDEGWYLYAANMFADGKMPYRDFQYTQGPLLPMVYSFFTWVWNGWGLLGARLFTLFLGLVSVYVFARTAADLAPEDRRHEAALVTVFLLGCNLYHLYYIAIPKTYALASLLVACGFRWLVRGVSGKGCRRLALIPLQPLFTAGLFLAFAAGARISLGAILCVVGCWFLFRREWKRLAWFCAGGFLGLGIVYGPYLFDQGALAGLVAAQKYHAARGGFNAVFTVGSLSRLVRWYLPVFIVLGLGLGMKVKSEAAAVHGNDEDPAVRLLTMTPAILLLCFLAVFSVQMLAPFPYEDYQVPIMGLLVIFAAVMLVGSEPRTTNHEPRTTNLLLVFGLAYACAFGSPLLQEWTINGQDRFWSLKKQKTELAQLRDVAETIEALDPGGKTILTQDLYLAVETGRKVPEGLEMGPFAMMSDEQWRELLSDCECEIAALSGYTFAINPPRCDERPVDQQMEYWDILRRRYDFVVREDDFGQNATPLLILKRK